MVLLKTAVKIWSCNKTVNHYTLYINNGHLSTVDRKIISQTKMLTNCTENSLQLSIKIILNYR